MRVALLITGEFREFAIAHKFWPFLHWEDLDIYFSLWSTSTIVYSLDHKEIEPINYKLINSLNPKACSIEQPWTGPQHNSQRMIHRIKEGFKLILNSGIQYDVIMTIRPDLAFVYKEEDFREELARSFEEQKCLIDGYAGLDGSGDAIIMYPINVVHEFLNYNFDKHFDFSNPDRIKGDIHKLFGFFFYGKADTIKDMTQRHAIVRPNARMLRPQQQKSFKQVVFKSAEWWEKYHGIPNIIPGLVYDKNCP